MFTTNKIFLDSSLFVEGFKGNHRNFLDYITAPNYLDCYINDTVCSEYWFYLFALTGNASPLALKERGSLRELIQNHFEWFTFFSKYQILSVNEQVTYAAFEMMGKYQLLPNDSFILATCKYYGINFLPSHDSDFEDACKAESIQLITAVNYLDKLPRQ